mgnify:FL=1
MKRKFRNNITNKGMRLEGRDNIFNKEKRVEGEKPRFFSSKGQQQVLSVILITGVLIGVVGSVYFWGLPLIQKNRDISLQQNAENFMENTVERFKFVANHGGRERLQINVPGNVVFDPSAKTLELTIETQGTSYETDTWIQLSKNGCTFETGRWGIDEPETLCVRSTKAGDTYVTVYRLNFLQLNTETIISYKIDMSGASSIGNEDNVIVVQNTGTQTVNENGRDVVKTTLSISID